MRKLPGAPPRGCCHCEGGLARAEAIGISANPVGKGSGRIGDRGFQNCARCTGLVQQIRDCPRATTCHREDKPMRAGVELLNEVLPGGHRFEAGLGIRTTRELGFSHKGTEPQREAGNDTLFLSLRAMRPTAFNSAKAASRWMPAFGGFRPFPNCDTAAE